MVGDDPAVRGLLAAVKKVARSNSTVLVRGESGTGKELVAEAIHRASDSLDGTARDGQTARRSSRRCC